ncbi:hypothetical protein BDV93DRAFT_454070 [Ceratobasidium sp. AG-I]|nr:hypothetical protein BDV93DRAFT_454070 [Ceratobasidium sp. AG-I]
MHCWAHLNHSAGSTSKQGPGSRLHSIDHVMHQWNWCKTTGMGMCSRLLHGPYAHLHSWLSICWRSMRRQLRCSWNRTLCFRSFT